MTRYGYHYSPCNRGGGGAAAGLIALAVIVILIARSAHTIEHGAEVVLEVVAITAGSILGLAALGAGAYVALRIHRSRNTNRQAIPRHAPYVLRGAQHRSAPRRQAIEAPERPLYVIHDQQHDHDPL